MPTILKKPLVQSDLIDIWGYIAENNSIEVADQFLETLQQKFEVLSENPYMGRSREEVAPNIRSFPAGNYAIFYRPMEEGIEIVRVFHASRDIDNMFPP